MTRELKLFGWLLARDVRSWWSAWRRWMSERRMQRQWRRWAKRRTPDFLE